MKIIEFGKEELINISFEEQAILEGIRRISEEEGTKWEEEKVKITSHFKKYLVSLPNPTDHRSIGIPSNI